MNKSYIQYMAMTFIVSFTMILIYKLIVGHVDVGIVYSMTMITCMLTGRWLIERIEKG